jgi:ribosomal protein L11 methyltransferase
VVVPAGEAEALVATLIELVPAGHELSEGPGGVELAVYVEPAELPRLRDHLPGLASQPVDPGWPDAWRRFHQPIVAGRLWVGPPWEPPAPGLDAIVIDPGRAFGTGAHPTTQLCLALLQELGQGSVLDAGCGSGVLAIAAARLGFAPVLAVDSDAAAVEVARANAAANDVRVEVALADATGGDLPQTDVVVANIDLRAVERLAATVGAQSLVVSGYLESDSPCLPGWHRLERRRADGWAADLLERQ